MRGAWCTITFAMFAPLAVASPPISRTIPSAYYRAAQDARVPPSLLFALALQESGTSLRGRLVPWPWTLNVAGDPARYATRRDACAALVKALRTSSGPVDVGLGQINVRFHRDRVRAPCELLDPYRNLSIAASILREQYRPGEPWSLAVGRYHRPAGGAPARRYRRSVERRLGSIVGVTLASTTMHGASP
jgi:soluble lytic murein transglycosylase-like protein